MAHRLVSCIREIESKRGNQNPRGLLCYDLKQSRMDSRWSHLTTLERCNVSFLAWSPAHSRLRSGKKGSERRKTAGMKQQKLAREASRVKDPFPFPDYRSSRFARLLFFPPSPGASGPRRCFFRLFRPLRNLVPSFFRIILRFCETAHLATPHLSQHFALSKN